MRCLITSSNSREFFLLRVFNPILFKTRQSRIAAILVGWFAGCLLCGCTPKPPAEEQKKSSGGQLNQATAQSSPGRTNQGGSNQGSANQGSTNPVGANPVGAEGSGIKLEWLEGAVPLAVVKTGKENGNLFLPETTGGGIGAFDFDRDGWTDIVCAGGGEADAEKRQMIGASGALYRRIGTAGNGVAGGAAGTPTGPTSDNVGFQSVGQFAGIDFSQHYNTGIAIADFDGDGFPDLFVAGYSNSQLFRNQGDGTYESLDCQAIGLSSPLWGASAAFFDADADGLLDLYVANYANWSFDNNPVCGQHARTGTQTKSTDYCGPREFQGLPDVFYHNAGDGTFRDITRESGLEDALRGLGVIAADWDQDGDVDLYVANDVDPNLLYRNDGGGRFTEIGRRAGVATNDSGTPEGSMGVAVGDYNLDGKSDLWVTNYQNELGALYRNSGGLVFNYASLNAKIAATDEASVGWGTAFADLDGDGDEDLLVVNGHIELAPKGSTVDQRPQVLQNQGGKTFQLVPRSNAKFLDTPMNARGLATADFNRDGKLDFVASRVDKEAALVLNRSQDQRSVRLRLVGTKSNRDAIGARIQLQFGRFRAVRQVIGGGSYASTSDLLVHIGIPSEEWKAESVAAAQISIDWPSGQREEFTFDAKSGLWDEEKILVEGVANR
jgi:hypothetical protein